MVSILVQRFYSILCIVSSSSRFARTVFLYFIFIYILNGNAFQNYNGFCDNGELMT